MKAHVAQWKKDTVASIAKQIAAAPIVGVLNMESLPAAQLARMKSKLRGGVDILMTRRTLLQRALAAAGKNKPGLEKIDEHMKTGMPALLFTRENPFSLYKTLKKSKSRAAAKPGQIAPYDIVIPAGLTPFAPGPVISEFAQIGVKAGVEGGKVAVKQDSVVAKTGEPIKPAVASMMARLGMEPMEIGLNLVAVYEGGTVYPGRVLDIDEAKFTRDLCAAVAGALSLAVDAVIPTNDSTPLLLQKAWREARSIALETGLLANGLVEDVLGHLHNVATSMKEELKL